MERFDPFEYLLYLRERWRFAVLTVAGAMLLTAIACFLMTPVYTATARLIIDPPAGPDPRTSTAMNAIYLESLKSYEAFASSDTVFAKAADKYHLLDKGATFEDLKRSALRVTKLKDTRILEIQVSLANPTNAQAVAQYLAEEAVALNQSLASQRERPERLSLIDPGVVPQKPSSPRTSLYLAAAFVIASVLSLVYLTMQFGLARQRKNLPEVGSDPRVMRVNR
jgi:capsular polysaccharide biosynthesis protein